MILKKEVKHIAELARLGLTDKEVGKMQKELSSILDYMDKLKEVDTSEVKPIFYSLLIENVMREDQPQKQSLEKLNRLVKVAPETEKRFVKVKTVLKEK